MSRNDMPHPRREGNALNIKRSAQTSDLIRFLHALNEAGVDYVICGGLACILHGLSRTTEDIDLRVDLRSDNLRNFVAVARRFDMTLRIPEPLDAIVDEAKRRDWIESKNAKVITLNARDSALQVDVFLQYPLSFEELVRRADTMNVGGLTLRVSSIADLIHAKRQVDPPRKQDQRDIEDLQQLLDEQNHEQPTDPDNAGDR